MTNNHIEVHDNNYERTISLHKLVLIVFWGHHCMPCRMMEPIIDQVALKYNGKLRQTQVYV